MASNRFKETTDTQKKKSVILQYNTLVRWANGTNNLSTKRLMFKVFFFFITSCKILCKNPFNWFFNVSMKLQKWKWRVLSALRLSEIMKKNSWKDRGLADESFVPLAQQTSILSCRLLDLRQFWPAGVGPLVTRGLRSFLQTRVKILLLTNAYFVTNRFWKIKSYDAIFKSVSCQIF